MNYSIVQSRWYKFEPNWALGLDTILSPIFQTAKLLILFILYLDLETTKLSNAKRDQVIRRRYAGGESISKLARAYNISPQRVFQVVTYASNCSLLARLGLIPVSNAIIPFPDASH